MVDSPIKITSFQHLTFQKAEQESKPPRGQYILNIVLYSVKKSLKFLDPCIRDINENNEVHIVKCNNISKLAYSLDSCKRGIKTICITDEQIDGATIEKIKENQDLMKNKHNFVCWLFTPEVEVVSPEWFHSPQIQLIACDEGKIIQSLKSEYERVRVKLGAFNSTTTIQSTDKLNMNIKLEIFDSPEKKILGEDQFYSRREDRIFDNGVPGVGTYDVNSKAVEKKSPTTTFSHSKK